MAWWQLGGSLTGVALLVLLAWKLGFSDQATALDESEARELADGLPGGFMATEVAVDRSGRGAILRDGLDRIAVVAPLGAHFVAHLLAANAAVRVAGPRLVITDRGFAVSLELGTDTERWARALRAID